MSNLDNITKKILDEAREQVKQMEVESEELQKRMLSESLVEADQKKEQMLLKAKESAWQIKERTLSSAKLRRRDQLLRAKQNLLERVFDMAKKKLSNLDEESFKSFLAAKLQEITLSGKEKLIVPTKMLEAVKGMGLDLDVEARDDFDGFQLADEKKLLNFSFLDLVDSRRSEMEGDIISMLFSEEE